MHDGHRADQPDLGPRSRRLCRWRTWRRPGGARRTLRGHGPAAGTGWIDPYLTSFMGDTAGLVGQPVLHASLGDAVMDVSSCMLPPWPWASTGRRKDSRPPHPTAPPRADRHRLPRSSSVGRGRAHAGRPGRPSVSRTHTLSGASDTTGGDSADGSAQGADSTGVGGAQPQRDCVSPPPTSPPVSPPSSAFPAR
jgi:hypothetical protein